MPSNCASPTRPSCFLLLATSHLLAQGSRQTILHCTHWTSDFLLFARIWRGGWCSSPIARIERQPLFRLFLEGGLDPVSHCACPTRVFRDRALHEHRRPSSLPSHIPSLLAFLLGGWPGLVPQLRTSNDHSFIVGVP